MHSNEFAGNQGKLQNFDPSSLLYKFALIFMRMKQKIKNFFEQKKNSKWPIFSRKVYRLVLGLVELIDAKAVNVAQPIWS